MLNELLPVPSLRRKDGYLSHGGGKNAAREQKVPFLGELPIDPKVRSGGDTGSPIVIEDPDSP